MIYGMNILKYRRFPADNKYFYPAQEKKRVVQPISEYRGKNSLVSLKCFPESTFINKEKRF